jgi:hypothetical protein
MSTGKYERGVSRGSDRHVETRQRLWEAPVIPAFLIRGHAVSPTVVQLDEPLPEGTTDIQIIALLEDSPEGGEGERRREEQRLGHIPRPLRSPAGGADPQS